MASAKDEEPDMGDLIVAVMFTGTVVPIRDGYYAKAARNEGAADDHSQADLRLR